MEVVNVCQLRVRGSAQQPGNKSRQTIPKAGQTTSSNLSDEVRDEYE